MKKLLFSLIFVLIFLPTTGFAQTAKEILEYNDTYINNSFEMSKAFLCFAKEYNNYDTYRN